MTFNVGDRVVYVGKSTQYRDPRMNGSFGLVTTDINITGCVSVEWETGPIQGKRVSHYIDNLELINVEVGDLEDDI